MILSRTFREEDWPALVPEGGVLMSIQNVTQYWHSSLFLHSLWEYAMALKATRAVFKNKTGLRVADFGYSMGLSPALLWLGHQVTLVEMFRRMPMEENYLLAHLRMVKERRTVNIKEPVEMWQVSQGSLQYPEEKKFDAVYSCSQLARLGDIDTAFENMCSLVRQNGLLFISTSEEDREQKIRQFNKDTYEKFVGVALRKGFKLVDGLTEWDWNNRVNTYTSLVLVKNG